MPNSAELGSAEPSGLSPAAEVFLIQLPGLQDTAGGPVPELAGGSRAAALQWGSALAAAAPRMCSIVLQRRTAAQQPNCSVFACRTVWTAAQPCRLQCSPHLQSPDRCSAAGDSAPPVTPPDRADCQAGRTGRAAALQQELQCGNPGHCSCSCSCCCTKLQKPRSKPTMWLLGKLSSYPCVSQKQRRGSGGQIHIDRVEAETRRLSIAGRTS